MMKHDERFNGSFGLKNNIKKGNKKRINRFGISKERKGVWYSVITVALLVFVLVILSAIAFYSVYQNTLVPQLISANEEILEKTDILVSETYSQIENMAVQISLDTMRMINRSNDSIVTDYHRLQMLSDSLVNFKNSHRYVHSAYIYFNQGDVIVTSSGMGVTSFNLFYDTAWYDYYRTHTTAITWLNCRKPYSSTFTNVERALQRYGVDDGDVITLLVPLSESLRSRGGVVVVNIYEEEVAKLLPGDDDYVYQAFGISKNGMITISSDRSFLYRKADPDLVKRIQEYKGNGHLIIKNADAQTLILFTDSDQTETTLVVEMPLNRILSPTQTLLRRIILISAALLLVSCLFVFFLYRQSLQPISKLYKTIEESLSSDGNSQSIENSVEQKLRNIIQDNKQLHSMWENNRTLIRHRTLSLLLEGQFTGTEDTFQRLRYMDIEFPYRLINVIYINMDILQQARTLTNDEYELVKIQLFPMIKECLDPSMGGYTVDIDDFHLGVILNYEVEEPDKLLRFCQNVQSAVDNSAIIPYTLSLGIGSSVDSIDEIYISAQNARSAADYASSLGGNEIISYSTISLFQDNKSFTLSSTYKTIIERELLPAIRIGDFDLSSKAFQKALACLENSSIAFADCQQYCLLLLHRISSLMQEMGFPLSEASQITDSANLFSSEDKEQLQDVFLETLSNACSQVEEKRKNKNADLMEQVVSYIDQHFQEDISLNQLSKAVYMSVPYFCKIFKEYTGKTFMDYLTGLRIDTSKELLLTTNQKIMDISISCGFANVQTYIRSFKKYCDVTPTAFRKQNVSTKLN